MLHYDVLVLNCFWLIDWVCYTILWRMNFVLLMSFDEQVLPRKMMKWEWPMASVFLCHFLTSMYFWIIDLQSRLHVLLTLLIVYGKMRGRKVKRAEVDYFSVFIFLSYSTHIVERWEKLIVPTICSF